MKTKSRITSVLKANHLDESITGFPMFNLSELNVRTDLDFELPTKLRLGHMVEKIVSELIKSSTNYEMLHENIQIMKGKNTIGELDFIIKNTITNQLIHLELAYKFYLYDPTLSENPSHNWIGPNRKDSLKEKLEKLKTKQFPLLFNEATKSKFTTIKIAEVSQMLCLLVSLFVPYEYKGKFDTVYEKVIKGYYVNFEEFKHFNHSGKAYYLPTKKEWGIDPSENENWSGFEVIKKEMQRQLQKEHSPLCWQKHKDSYESFFIVWW